MTDSLIFLGYVVSVEGIEKYEEKVKPIPEWPTLTNIGEVRSFHGLATFYRCLSKTFSTIPDPLIDYLKQR